MARQREYMSGLLSKLSDMDVAKLTKTVADANKYLTLGISLPDMVSLLLKMKKYKNLELITIDGTSKIDENGFNAYYLDEDSLKKAIYKLYYQSIAFPATVR
jgi:anionic cell wall polymer biosynthesis LytR-Cps2A-Psr (LCP) family protein